MNGKFVAYYRVSTAKQGKSGLGLEAQKQAVTNYLNGGRWKLAGEFVEVESGKRDDRPKLVEALSLCRLLGATLLVAKLDRLARNVQFTATLLKSSVKFTAVDFPDANNLTIHILAAVAEHEAVVTGTRTKAALAAAKAKGTKLGCGNDKIAAYAKRGAKASAAKRSAKVAKRNTDLIPRINHYRAEGAVTLRQIAARLNDDGVATARGGEWSAVQVSRVMQTA
jgi:DNA invertase Pin-like site-specific DNA recombinase